MNKTVLLVVVATVITGTSVFFGLRIQAEKTGYVDISKLFSEFKLKQELEIQLTKVKQSRKVVTDSLEFGLKLLAKQIQAEGQKDKSKIALFELKREEYIEKKRHFEEDNEAVTKQYDAQIISQLNQYVKDYGIKNGYTYIFGADGSGFLMFSAEKKDITEDVKKYINERYKGNTE